MRHAIRPTVSVRFVLFMQNRMVLQTLPAVEGVGGMGKIEIIEVKKITIR